MTAAACTVAETRTCLTKRTAQEAQRLSDATLGKTPASRNCCWIILNNRNPRNQKMNTIANAQAGATPVDPRLYRSGMTEASVRELRDKLRAQFDSGDLESEMFDTLDSAVEMLWQAEKSATEELARLRIEYIQREANARVDADRRVEKARADTALEAMRLAFQPGQFTIPRMVD